MARALGHVKNLYVEDTEEECLQQNGHGQAPAFAWERYPSSAQRGVSVRFSPVARQKRRRLPVPQAIELMIQQEIDRLIDQEKLHEIAIQRCEEGGVVFLDELDKICGNVLGESGGPDVSRTGVQRDLLPIVEGSTVSTRYGMVRTAHILFIAAGAFIS